jgi:hypothetical protein
MKAPNFQLPTANVAENLGVRAYVLEVGDWESGV